MLWAQSDASTVPHLHGESGPDALERQTLLELARLYREMKLQGPRSENLRAFAARVRTMAVYYQATGRSDAVSRHVAALVDEHGRDIVIATAKDLQRLQQTLQTYGIEPVSTGVDRFIDPPFAARSATLDTILTGGVAALFEQGATALERAATSIDMHMAAIRPIRVAQVDDSWCAAIVTQISSHSYASTLFCSIAIATPEFEGECNVAWLATIYMIAISLVAGCI